MSAPTPFHLAAPAALLRTEKAPMRHLGLFGPNQSSPLDASRPRDERSRVEWTGAGATAGPGGGNPWASGPERSVRPSAAEGQRAGSAEAARKGESPTDGQTLPAVACPARATHCSVPKESRPGPKPEARTDRRPGAERTGQSAEAGTTKLFAPPVPGAADAGWHRAKLSGAGYVVPCQEPHCGYYVCPGNCGCASDETCRQCGHRLHDGEEFGLGGLPSLPKAVTQQNDTREAEGRPAPFRFQHHRPELQNQNTEGQAMPLMTCEVISERKNEYPAKRGFVSDRLITLVDQEATKGARFRTAFEHRLSDDEKRKFEPDALTGKLIKFEPDALTGKLIKFGLTNTASFQGGRLGFEGNIIEVVGAKPAVKA